MSPAGGANYIGPSEKAPYACIATCAAVVQFAVYHMPPPGFALKILCDRRVPGLGRLRHATPSVVATS